MGAAAIVSSVMWSAIATISARRGAARRPAERRTLGLLLHWPPSDTPPRIAAAAIFPCFLPAAAAAAGAHDKEATPHPQRKTGKRDTPHR